MQWFGLPLIGFVTLWASQVKHSLHVLLVVYSAQKRVTWCTENRAAGVRKRSNQKVLVLALREGKGRKE